MSKTYDEDLDVPQGISCGNWLWGSVQIQAQTGEIVTVDVTGLTVEGTGTTSIQASPRTKHPWYSVGTVSVTPAQDGIHEFDDPDWNESSFRIHFIRTSNTLSTVDWMIWRDATT